MNQARTKRPTPLTAAMKVTLPAAILVQFGVDYAAYRDMIGETCFIDRISYLDFVVAGTFTAFVPMGVFALASWLLFRRVASRSRAWGWVAAVFVVAILFGYSHFLRFAPCATTPD